MVITSIIEDLTQEWLGNGTVTTARDIGSGLCEEFAEEVVRLIAIAHPELAQAVEIRFTDDWWISEQGEINAFVADVPALRKAGEPLPAEIPDNDLANTIGGMTHAWIWHDGRNYDATCPEGVQHFLTMPFFADQLSSLSTRYSGDTE